MPDRADRDPLDARVVAALSDDALLERGVILEQRLGELLAAADAVNTSAAPRKRELRRAAIKLGINGVVLAAGIAVAPVTLGLSLVLTVVSTGMLVWDGADFARGLAEQQHGGLDLADIGAQVLEVERELDLIARELDHRTAP